MVDAGMRELWQTGYMHNRVRMIVGSFLVKNQLIDWRKGEAWFWDCLVDGPDSCNIAMVSFFGLPKRSSLEFGCLQSQYL